MRGKRRDSVFNNAKKANARDSLAETYLRARLEDGTALAALAADHESAAALGVSGSPTFVLNEGRQKLYGNVGYRILEANVEELLRDDRDSASWC